MKSLAKGQWTSEAAWAWYNAQPWIRGWCGYPANCVNRIAIWQEYGHAEVAEQIDYEFGIAEELGFNAYRMIIQFEAWCFEHDAFMANFEEYLTLVWLDESYNHIEGSGLAGSVRAEQTYNLTLLNVDGDVVYHGA